MATRAGPIIAERVRDTLQLDGMQRGARPPFRLGTEAEAKADAEASAAAEAKPWALLDHELVEDSRTVTERVDVNVRRFLGQTQPRALERHAIASEERNSNFSTTTLASTRWHREGTSRLGASMCTTRMPGGISKEQFLGESP